LKIGRRERLLVVVIAGAAIVVASAVIASRAADDPVPSAPDSASDAPITGTRIAAAGDIACDPASSSYEGGAGTDDDCRQAATSDLLVGAGYAAVLALGDLQYENGAADAFLESYDPTWGRVKSVTAPVPGNHEYRTGGAAGYFSYFGARAGDPDKGYYSFDLAGWHLVALNSNCSKVGGCGAGSPQERWLRRDLAASTPRCTLAFWHHPRFSSGWHGGRDAYAAFWQALYDAGADVVLVGHDHDYERFAPQDGFGRRDLARGVREFVVGTGGKKLRGMSGLEPNSEAHDGSTFGVLELTLGRSAYAWRFRPADGSFADGGSYRCH
jgi:hypothetical protein